MEEQELAKHVAYLKASLKALDDLSYWDYVMGYDVDRVAQSCALAIEVGFDAKWSPMFTALMIFGHTWWKIKNGLNIDDLTKH